MLHFVRRQLHTRVEGDGRSAEQRDAGGRNCGQDLQVPLLLARYR